MVNARWASLSPVARVTTVLIGVLVVFGVVLRVQRLGAPANFTFDEELFVRPAHGYLLGRPDGNDHPPLGKLFMAVGMILFGANTVGWRFASLVFGLFTLVLVQWLGTELFRSRRAGWLACAFFAADGFFIGYSRTGLLDGMLAALVLWAFLAAVVAEGTLDVLGSALLVGLAMSVKWSGAFAVFPAAAAVLLLGRVKRFSVLLFALAPAVHVLVWMGGLALTGEKNDLRSLFGLMVRLFKHHQEMGTHDNALASPWYSWIVLHHPIVVKLASHGIGSTYASTVSNLATWAAGIVCLVGTPVMALVDVVRERLKKPRLLERSFVTAMLLAWVGWLALLSPWMVGRGKYTFHYHYLPCAAFVLLLVAGGAAVLERKHERLVLAFVAAVLAVAIYFAPVWGEATLTEHAAHLRLWFKLWQP